MAVVTRREARSEKRAAIEEAVLRATEEMLAEGAPFAELNVERIATAAGISRPAFYFYFRDKRELLMRLTEGAAARLYEEAEDWWEAGGVEPLRRALAQIVDLYREHGVLLRAIVEVSTYDEEVAVFWRGLVGRFVDATRDRIEAEQRAGEIDRSIPADATAFALVWMTERACYEALVQSGGPDPAELLEALGGVWLRGLYGRTPAAQ